MTSLRCKMADIEVDSTLRCSQSSLTASTISSSGISKSSDVVAGEMAVAFSKYTNFSVDKEETKFNEGVELMLTKLDEFFSLVDMVRSDTTLCLSTTLPGILTKCDEMDAIFHKIDKLEEFVSMVRENVLTMEEKVVKAETDLSSMAGLMKKFTSFVSLKKSQSKPAVYLRPKIFKTSNFFNCEDDKSETASISSLVKSSSDSSQMDETNSHNIQPVENS